MSKDQADMSLSQDEAVEHQLWLGDQGSLTFATRKALLQLVRGPLLTEEGNRSEWQALVNNLDLITSRLADMFLELVVDFDAGVAFVKNAFSEETQLPKAVKTLPLTLVDTIMLLHLRRELLVDNSSRIIIGREELFSQLANYRPVVKIDEAGFRKRLGHAWSKFVKAGILQPLDTEDRCEISPVLKLLFGVDEVKALSREYEQLLNGALRSEQSVVSDEDEDVEEAVDE